MKKEFCLGGIVKKVFMFLAVIFLASSICRTENVYAKSGSMKIHAINLNDRGDAVLLESNGEYILMDAGMNSSYSQISKYLKKVGVKELSLYISHFHTDHTGGNGGATTNYETGLTNLMKDFTVTKLYLQDKTLIPKYDEGKARLIEWKKDYVKEYGEENEDNVVSLKVGDKFSVGDANFEIIGPVNVNKLTYSDANEEGDEENAYPNSTSLVAMITCGNTKYLTAGDLKNEEEALLIKKYGSQLSADIFKMNHHGMSPANTENFIEYVKPSYSFGQNAGAGQLFTDYTIYNQKNKRRRTAKVRGDLAKYSYCYLVADEDKTLVIDVNNDNIKLYREGNTKAINSPNSWDKPVGGDGIYRKTNSYYFGKDGKAVSGIKKIDGKYYSFTQGGCVETGKYYAQGNKDIYYGWVYETKNKITYKKYFVKNTDEIYVGFHEVDGNLYYFDPKTGYVKLGDKNSSVVKIGKYKYAITTSGILQRNTWKKYSDGCRYFNNKGRMCTGWTKVDSKTYYLNLKSGVRTIGFNEINGKCYFFDNSGVMKQNTNYARSGLTYVINKSGVITKLGTGAEVKINSVSSGSKSLTIKMNFNHRIDGVEILTSTSKNGKYKLAKDVKASNMTSAKVTGLSSGKTYYVKVRSYRQIGTKKVYSDKSFECSGKAL